MVNEAGKPDEILRIELREHLLDQREKDLAARVATFEKVEDEPYAPVYPTENELSFGRFAESLVGPWQDAVLKLRDKGYPITHAEYIGYGGAPNNTQYITVQAEPDHPLVKELHNALTQQEQIVDSRILHTQASTITRIEFDNLCTTAEGMTSVCDAIANMCEDRGDPAPIVTVSEDNRAFAYADNFRETYSPPENLSE